MIKSRFLIASAALAALAGSALAAERGTSSSAGASNPAFEKVESAVQVLRDIQAAPEKGIPQDVLAKAQGVAIFPGMVKVGVAVGGEYGSGVLLVRDKEGEWSNPVFLRLIAGSVGPQLGAESADVVLVFKTRRSVDGVLNGKFTLGADAAVAAGPVGRRAEAATDMRTEILSYSRNRGLFAGISVEGALLAINDKGNGVFYGQRDIAPQQIVAGRVEAPSVAQALRRVVMEYSSERPT